MKISSLLVFAFVASGALAAAQSSSDDLTVTLPTGKVLTFPTAAQKASFLASRDRLRQPSQAAASPTPAAPSAASPPSTLGHTALDEKPAMPGRVNVSAPTFTARYYLFAPETWVGKKVTLSVAYVTAVDSVHRADGMHQLEAHTWGRLQATGEHDSGGRMTLLASPEAAERVSTLCGTSYQYDSGGTKMTLIHGQFEVLHTSDSGVKEYGLIVTQ